jgi:hypothetical protein
MIWLAQRNGNAQYTGSPPETDCHSENILQIEGNSYPAAQ